MTTTDELLKIKRECEEMLDLAKPMEPIYTANPDVDAFFDRSRTILPKAAGATIMLIVTIEGLRQTGFITAETESKLNQQLINDWNAQ